MILKALYDYYNRCGDLAPTGMEYKEISFLVVLDEKGNFKRLEHRGDAKNGQKFLVMKGVRSGTTPKPYLFWDNVEYVFDFCKEQTDAQNETDEAAKKKLEAKMAKTHAKNVALVEEFKEISNLFPEEKELKAVCDFYDKGGLDAVKKDSLWPEVEKKPTVNVSFLVEGRTKIVAENPCLQSLVTSSDQGRKQKHSVCLITGEQCDPVATTTPTTIAGGNPTGSRLVAFQVNSGYDSYGKSKCLNAPMSKEAEAAFTTALNRLLTKGSHNKFMLGNRSFVFWASSNNEASQKMEESLFDLLGFSEESVDDPNAKIEEVRKVFKAISSGMLKTNLDDRFYILGLAPNSARIAVVYWSETSLREFASKIEQHFSDMEIVDNRKERKPYMGLRNMLSTVTQSGKLSDVTPNLPESVAKSIFDGLPYPYTLFSSCIRRIRAENGDVRITRAAIMKAYLNRLNEKNQNKITIMLDQQNHNPGYLCGRLFAVLENLQFAANGQDSIRASYMNAASSTPSAVFPTILKLSNSHYSKLAKDKKGLAIFFDNQKKEIMAMIQDFPDTLELSDQGRFFLGYYHQKNYKESKETEQL